MMGRTNASVLPVPVCAVATKSRPASAGSMASSWMGVGWTKPCLDRLLLSRADRGNSEKLFICNFAEGETTSRLPVRAEGDSDQLPVSLSIARLEAGMGGLLSHAR